MRIIVRRQFLSATLVCCALAAGYYTLSTNNRFSDDYSDPAQGAKNIKKAEVSTLIKPAEPKIVPARYTFLKEFEDAKSVATFPVQTPRWIPERFELVELKHVRPNLPDIPESTHNDTISALYSDGIRRVVIIQGYFSGGDVPVGPGPSGEVRIREIKANWVRGSWGVTEQPAEEFTNQKQWRDGTLQLGWYNNNLGYTLITDGLELETLIRIADGLI